jgi:hypothetical protein
MSKKYFKEPETQGLGSCLVFLLFLEQLINEGQIHNNHNKPTSNVTINNLTHYVPALHRFLVFHGRMP